MVITIRNTMPRVSSVLNRAKHTVHQKVILKILHRGKPGNTLGYESPRGQAVPEMAGSKAHRRDCNFWETPN